MKEANKEKSKYENEKLLAIVECELIFIISLWPLLSSCFFFFTLNFIIEVSDTIKVEGILILSKND